MEIEWLRNSWAQAAIMVCIAYVLVAVVIPALFKLLHVLLCAALHVHYAFKYTTDPWAVVRKLPVHIFRAYRKDRDYNVDLTQYISFSYKTGPRNVVTDNIPWLNELAARFGKGAVECQIRMYRDHPDLQCDETIYAWLTEMKFSDGKHLALYLGDIQDNEDVVAMIAHDFTQLQKTLNAYVPAVKYILVGSMTNTIEYISTVEGLPVEGQRFTIYPASPLVNRWSV